VDLYMYHEKFTQAEKIYPYIAEMTMPCTPSPPTELLTRNSLQLMREDVLGESIMNRYS